MAEPTTSDDQQQVTETRQSDVWKEWTQVLDEYKKAQADQAERLETLFRLVQSAGQHTLNAPLNTARSASTPSHKSSKSKNESTSKSHWKTLIETHFYRSCRGDIICGVRAGDIQFQPKIPLGRLEAIGHEYGLEHPYSELRTDMTYLPSALFFASVKAIVPRVNSEWSYELGVHQIPDYYLPNFVPSWELQADPANQERCYHIDDVSHAYPISFNLDAPENHIAVSLAVPYAFVPPCIPSMKWFPRVSIAWRTIQDTLGNLFSVPPDGRVNLAFDKTRLRCMKEHHVLDQFLDRSSTIKTTFDERDLEFFILDFDNSGAVARYSYGSRAPTSLISTDGGEVPPHAAASYGALYFEHHRLTIPPVLVPWTFTRIPVTENIFKKISVRADHKPRHWWRFINLEGASQLLVEEQTPVGDACSTPLPSPHFGSPAEWESPVLETFIAEIWRKEGVPAHPATAKIASMFFGQVDRDTYAINTMLPVINAFNWHLLCHQHQPRPFPVYDQELPPIHFTWHSLVEPSWKMQSSHWPLGDFYLDKSFQLQKQAFTVLYIPGLDWQGLKPGSVSIQAPPESGEEECFDNNHFWTILALQPPSVSDSQSRCDFQHLNREDQSPILTVLTHGLALASDAHRRIADAFDKEFGAETLITDPHAHDKLLVDDDNFSRSRKYFWSVNFLETVMKQIDQTEQEMDMFLETKEKEIRNCWLSGRTTRLRVYSRGKCEQMADKQVGEIKGLVVELQNTRSRLDSTRKRVLTLRDGLFNASSVNESRASTRLGQNVKLLTYVSIFYLPLSFCVALWSINENYSRPPLAVTTILVGVATYFLVANMHNVDALRRRFVYKFVGKKVQEKMRGREEGAKWEERSGEIRGFRFDERTGGTSKWMVLRFWGRLGWGRFKGLFRKRGKKVETADGEQGVPPTS